MANKNGQKIFISLIVGVVVTCVALNTFSKMQKELKAKDQLIEVMKLKDSQNDAQNHTYLTFTHEMEAGETVKETDIMLTAFSKEQENALSVKEDVIGNVLLENVKSGQVLTEYIFTGVVSDKTNSSKGLKEGYRALTLSTSTLDGLSSEMKTGSLVDIFSKSQNNSVALSKVKILSLEPIESKTDNNQETSIPITQAKTVTFEVPINKIQELVEIYSSGKILLVMRPTGDDTVIVGKKQSTNNVKANYHSNYSYNSAALPQLPNINLYEEPIVNELPPPVKPKKTLKTVELIEANNKTQVNFD